MVRAPASWHLAALSVLAVSHPIGAVLVTGPEFFVAHDLDRTGIVLLGIGLFIGLPAGVSIIASTVARLHPHGRLLGNVLLAGFIAVIAAQALKQTGVYEHLIVPLAGLCGLLGVLLYGTFRAARLFVSALAPAPLVAGLVFFTSHPVHALVRGPLALPIATEAPARTPVVMIVFDQLPLLSLLNEERQIDHERFPNFAAFAESATWYRNTTAAATTTNWALPALLTARHPDASLMPSVVDHPNNLFSLLGGTHKLHVAEPITALCAPQLCQPGTSQGGGTSWLALSADLVVVYGHIVLPRQWAARLPSVKSNWRGFGFDFWQDRWGDRRDDDRRRGVQAWIDEIERSDEPTLHFLHVLLPHEPYVYLPTGQIGAAGVELPGLGQYERWTDDRQLVALVYRQHLLQVEFVDRLLGLILDRLKEVGVFDKALVVVVADHGAAFRPGRPYRQPEDSTLGEIGAVPFLVKSPGAKGGRVVDLPFQAIDVLPTMAHELRLTIPWQIDGRPAQLPSASPGTDKRRLYRDRAQRYVTFAADEFERSMRASEQRKRETVGPGNSELGWTGGAAPDLVGLPINSNWITGEPAVAGTLDSAAVFDVVDPAGPYVPVFVSGVVRALDGSSSVGTPLALAVNRVIRAATTPARHPVSGRQGFWAMLVAPEAYVKGRNEISLFEVLSASPPRLRPISIERRSDDSPNLLDLRVQATLGIGETGFHSPEWHESTIYRWTNGNACLTIPVDPGKRPRELEVTMFMGNAPDQTLEIRVNGCVLFDGLSVDLRNRRLPLASCAPDGNTLALTFLSNAVVPGPGDTRELGVALQAVRLR